MSLIWLCRPKLENKSVAEIEVLRNVTGIKASRILTSKHEFDLAVPPEVREILAVLVLQEEQKLKVLRNVTGLKASRIFTSTKLANH